MEGTCEHSDVCSRDALEEHEGKCILHSERPNKDEDVFEQAFYEHWQEHGPNFEDMVFPGVFGFGFGILEDACFAGATFEVVDFTASTFKGSTSFTAATFEEAKFIGATFEEVTFQGATFGKANFRGATFENQAFFDRSFEPCEDVQFINANFSACEFNGDVLFSGSSEEKRAFAGGKVKFRDVIVAPDASLRFRYADLSHCLFLRTNLRNIEFTGVKWSDEFSVDDRLTLDWFRDKYNHGLTTFWLYRKKEWFFRVGLYDEICEGSTSPETDNDDEKARWYEVERLYRQLKCNYEERGDFTRAGDFHIGEKEARRQNPDTNSPMRALLWTYRALSKYGERALPAAFWLLFVVLACAGAYATHPYTEGYFEALHHSAQASFFPRGAPEKLDW